MNKKMDTDIFKTVYETSLKLIDAAIYVYSNLKPGKDDKPEEVEEMIKSITKELRDTKNDIKKGKNYVLNNPFQAYNLSISMVQDIIEAELMLDLDSELVSLIFSLPHAILKTQTFCEEIQSVKAMYLLLIDDVTEAHSCILTNGRIIGKEACERIIKFAEERLEILDSFTPENESYEEMIPYEVASFDFYSDINVEETDFIGTKYFNQVLTPLLQIRYLKYLKTKNPSYAISTIAIQYYATHRVIVKYDFEKMKNIICCQEYSADSGDFTEIENGNFYLTIMKLPRQIRTEIGLWTEILTHSIVFSKQKKIIKALES